MSITGVFILQASEVDVGKWHKPSGGHGGRDVSAVHHALNERTGEDAITVGAHHHVGHHGLRNGQVGCLNAVGGDVEFDVFGDDVAGLSFREFFSGSFVKDLHIDAGLSEIDILVFLDIRCAVIAIELLFADDANVSGNVESPLSALFVHDLCAGHEEALDLFVLTLSLVGIGVVVGTRLKHTGKSNQHIAHKPPRQPCERTDCEGS